MITDFSDFERIGRDHYLNVNGGCASTKELENLDGEETACLLISEGEGVVTPYGVVYDNGMRLEQVYDGRPLPEYHHEPCVALVALSRPGQDGKETLYLSCPDIKIARALQRLGQRQIDEEGGEFGDRGYVAYKDTQPEIKEILGRHIPPTQGAQIGGMT